MDCRPKAAGDPGKGVDEHVPALTTAQGRHPRLWFKHRAESPISKVFCFFFSKKKACLCFSPSPDCHGRAATDAAMISRHPRSRIIEHDTGCLVRSMNIRMPIINGLYVDRLPFRIENKFSRRGRISCL